MIGRIKWLAWRRFLLQRQLTGFHASYRSFASMSSRFSEGNRLHGTAVVADSSLGRYSYVASGAFVHHADVGAFCSIGPDACVGGLGRHPTRSLSTHPIFFSTKGQVTRSFVDEDCFDEFLRSSIGSDVWIGARAIVLDGIRVGDGAIVAAGAVVSRDVMPYSIVAGVPARTVKARFSPKNIEILLRLQWWDWDIASLQAASSLFLEESDLMVEKLAMFRESYVVSAARRGVEAELIALGSSVSGLREVSQSNDEKRKVVNSV